MSSRRRFRAIRLSPEFRTLIQSAPADIRKALAELMGPILDHPLPRQSLLGVRPLRDPRLADAYTVPFADGKGLLVYQLMPDQPIIRLLDMTWVDD